MVFIRTDANKKIATGHLMRCINIAFEIEKLGETVVFLFQDDESVEILNNRFDYKLLNQERKVEIKELSMILANEVNPKLLLDSYLFDAKYMQSFAHLAKLITFDDMFAEKFPVDILINYNLYYKFFDYKKRYNSQETKLLLGGKYVPVREEFQNILPPQIKRRADKILLISGGGDQYHMLYNIIKDFSRKSDFLNYEFTIIAGVFNDDINRLYDFERKYSNVNLFVNTNNLGQIMKQMDIIVSAAGTVLYEACCVGVPTIFFSMAKNQENDSKSFSLNDTMYFAGDVQNDKQKVIDNIINIIGKLSIDWEERICMQKKMKKLIDGKGVVRIAKEVVEG